MRVRPGDVIAEKYEVEKVLAAGGMGVVLSAHHRQLKRRVALKFLLPELCATPGVVERFLREAQAMTAIQNEHIARVLDVGTTSDGSPYMVMEYLEGEDLGQTLDRRGRLSTYEAVDYVLQGMEALAEAHVNGFVHRDLKPSNLFITARPDGSPLVKVLDFGISKALDPKEADLKLTETRGMLGSPLYMAPEQIRSSKSVDTRADIWALGIILHELMTGKSPFDGDNLASVLASIIADDPVALRSVRPDTPDGLSEVILRCLNRDREQRYQTVADLAQALEPFAPPDARVSIDRIRKTIAHHQRNSTSPDLIAKTIPKGVTPIPDEWAPKSGLAQTHAAPTRAPDKRTPQSDPVVSVPAPVPTTTPNGTPTAGTDAAFGKYTLLALLGQGGMADVYLAALEGPEGFGFAKLVVLKRLRASLATDREFVSMLVDEARIAAKLNHPNVVQTHEVGVIDQEYYIAMEYLEGQPLNQIVQRTADGEAMSLAFKLGIIRDLLAGIHHAHELTDFDGAPLGLVHRDVTPQNVFVTYDGQVKVVDFGIAKARGRATETQQGVLKGKVRYMSPEQASGQEIDRRADIFSAGVILWELLTGERMWKGLDDVAIIQKLMLDKIPSSPRAVAPGVAPALDAIVSKALARKKADRYATAQELQLEIEHFMEAEGLKCTARELGAWVAALFAARRKQARSLIEGQLSKLSSAEARPSFHVLKLRDSSSQSLPANLRLERLDRDPTPPEDHPSRPAALARSDPNRTGISGSWSRPRSRWMILIGATLVLATMVVIGSLAARSRARASERPPVTSEAPLASSGPVEPTLVSAPPVSASAAPLAPIRVSLTAAAPGAEFAIDGEPKARSPLLLTRANDKQPHRITVTAPGYRTETKTVTFDADVVWTAQLFRADGAHVGAAASAAHSAAPSATSVLGTPVPMTSASSGRKKRELDPDNPYSGQTPPP
ncbi:MAG TPA: protein kinase [Labilithrix sp.]|nr:protein kinase [Labilithrix sp.]